jgi:TetR/AcrR family transcriptional regulator, tetracycline repressor protein
MNRKKNPLTVSQIVQVAMQLVDQEGATALAVRRIAREIGVDPMAIYYHIPSKEALIKLVIEALVGELRPVDTATPLGWQGEVRALCRAYRQLALDHPKAFSLVLAFPHYVPADLQIAESSVALFQKAGLSAEQSLQAFVVLQAFVEGFVLDEITHPGFSRMPREAISGYEKEYPHLNELKDSGQGQDGTKDFEFGLDVFLAGMQSLTV